MFVSLKTLKHYSAPVPAPATVARQPHTPPAITTAPSQAAGWPAVRAAFVEVWRRLASPWIADDPRPWCRRCGREECECR